MSAPLPAGAAVVGFDRDLTVTALNGDPLPPGDAPPTLARALGVLDPAEVDAAARAAIQGRAGTVICSLASGGPRIFVRLAHDPEAEGRGLALWVADVPPDDAGPSQHRERAEELDVICTMSRELARSTDLDQARGTICSAALSAGDATRAVLFEPDHATNTLRSTASIGLENLGFELPLNESSKAAEAFRTNCQRLTSRSAEEPPGSRSFLAAAGAGSAIWQPVSRGRTVRAVIAICWESPTETVAPRSSRLLEAIAVEAAVALDRGVAFDRLVSMARTDVLTGLPNRRAGQEALTREVARSTREGAELTVAMLDLDDFKVYNDTRGHQAGDRLLEAVAAVWRQAIRATDTLARFGGDEFALVLPRCNTDRARELIGRLPPPPGVEVGFSTGAVAWNGVEDAEALLGRADSALYEAKRAGPASLIVIP